MRASLRTRHPPSPDRRTTLPHAAAQVMNRTLQAHAPTLDRAASRGEEFAHCSEGGKFHPGKCRADCPRAAMRSDSANEVDGRDAHRYECAGQSPERSPRADHGPCSSRVAQSDDGAAPEAVSSSPERRSLLSCPTPLLRYTAASRALPRQCVTVDPRDAPRAPASMTQAVRTAQSPWWQGRRKRPHSDSEQLHWGSARP
jgi:hypothetical protein